MMMQEKLSTDTQRELNNLKGAAEKFKEAVGFLKAAANSIKGNSINQLRANAVVAKARLENAVKKITEVQMTQINLESLAQNAKEEAAEVQSIKISTEQNFTAEYVSSQARMLNTLKETIQEAGQTLALMAEENEPQLAELKEKAETIKQAIKHYAEELESLTHHVEELYNFMRKVKGEAAKEKITQRLTAQNMPQRKKQWWQFW